MEGSSSASKPYTRDESLLVDDLYFSALYDAEEIFPISDELYAEELQLQEALYSSAMVKNITKFSSENEEADDISLMRSNMRKHIKEVGESSLRICTICMDAKRNEEMFRSQNCTHSFCDDCIVKYVAVKIQENISNVKCPEPKCRGALEPQHCRSIIPKEVLDRWENALCENLVLASQKFYCPFKDCSAMLVADGGEEDDVVVTASECPHCHRLFCAQCKVSWHGGMGCEEFMSLNEGEREKEDLMVIDLAKSKYWRRCPGCKIYVEKAEGCNHISCRCGKEFCYTCGASWSSYHGC